VGAGLLVAVLGLSVAGGTGARAVAQSGATACSGSGGPGLLRGGLYTTRCFLPGMRITVPAGGWYSGEDTPVELKLNPPNTTDPESPALRAWIDPHASTPCTDKALPADISTPSKIIKWMKSNRNLIVKGPRRTRIARNVAALVVDLGVRRTAPRCDPSCPAACIDYFLFRAPNVAMHPYGTGPLEPAQFYFAQIGRAKHLFVFNVDAPNKLVFARMKAIAAKMVATLRLPSKLPSRKGR
jgi:hypothetical protein